MPTLPHLDSLRSCPALALISLNEPSENRLRLVVTTTVPGDTGLLHRPGHAVPAQDGAQQVFELLWPSYIGYSVLNEEYVSADRYECFEGRLLVRYQRSHYMDYMAAASFATTDYPGPLQHWGLFCVDHVINIASTEAPRIRVLESTH
ncbi:hypothetical protein [Chitinimonas sp.]|uniref:hypothetical protein n=1 Tax=Chitinimonas sp. TaxID=1934313 RepID=UPI002F92874E